MLKLTITRNSPKIILNGLVLNRQFHYAEKVKKILLQHKDASF